MKKKTSTPPVAPPPSTALTVPRASQISTDVTQLAERAKETRSAALAPRTRNAYAKAWDAFVVWCVDAGRDALPASPDTVVLFLQAEAERHMSTATVEQRVAAIAYMHSLKDASLPPPTKAPAVATFLAGLRRKIRRRPKQMTALRVEHLKKILPHLSTRDRAILLFGFATAMRRSEIAAVKMGDLEIEERGFLVHIPFSKTDQEGKGVYLGVWRGQHEGTCPVRAVEAWIELRSRNDADKVKRRYTPGTVGGPDPRLFQLSEKGVYRVVKRAVVFGGLDPKDFAGHSLRAGLVTEADEAGIDRSTIRRQTRHTSDVMLDRYSRPADAFKKNVTKDLGL